jgi:hypothetical protein
METLQQQKHAQPSSEHSRQGSVSGSEKPDGAMLYRVVSRLPQQIRHDYPPLLKHFLQRCVICSVAGKNSDNHTMPECSRRAAVLDFRPNHNVEILQLHRKLVFQEKSTHWKCFIPWFVCVDHEICPSKMTVCCDLICTSLATAWWMRTTSDICRNALHASHAPVDATTEEIREWLGQHVDPSASELNFVSNAAVVLMNLWSALRAEDASSRPAKRARVDA